MLIILSCLAGQFFAQTPKEIHAKLPAIDGWTLTQNIEVFDSDNLYERINGAAPLFIENNFREMTSMIYTHGDDYITIQAYRHASPEDAFGMYASERSPDMRFYTDIGGEAQGDNYGLFFFSGNMYVKIWSNNIDLELADTFAEIARTMATKIDSCSSYPEIFASFPKDGLIQYSQAYVTRNYIGHKFLKPAYTANYDVEGLMFQMFVIDGKSKDDAKNILNEYFEFTKQPMNVTEGNLCANDRYNGKIPLVWKGQYIVGAFSENGDVFPDKIYNFLNRFRKEL
jgi:hypothetical protein